MDAKQAQESLSEESMDNVRPAVRDVKEAQQFLAENGVDNVRLVVTDLMGMARGKRVPVKKFPEMTPCFCKDGAR